MIRSNGKYRSTKLYLNTFHTVEMLMKTRRQVLGNKAIGRISKRRLQENKAFKIFRKTNISYILICISTYQGVRNNHFLENLFYCYHRFEIRPFDLLPTKQSRGFTLLSFQNVYYFSSFSCLLYLSFFYFNKSKG